MSNLAVVHFCGVSHSFRAICSKWGIAQMFLSKTEHHFGGVLTSLTRYRAIWGIAAIASRAILCDMGPLRLKIKACRESR